ARPGRAGSGADRVGGGDSGRLRRLRPAAVGARCPARPDDREHAGAGRLRLPRRARRDLAEHGSRGAVRRRAGDADRAARRAAGAGGRARRGRRAAGKRARRARLRVVRLMGAEPRIRVSAILLWHDRVLLCRHEKPGKEYWLLPGGGVNSGESLVDALRRELSEEVGIDDPLVFEGPIAIVDSIAPARSLAAK